MNAARQVPWEEFTKIIGNQQFAAFTESDTVVVLFITDWSFPSRLALKRIKKFHFDKKRCGIIDVDLVDSIDLVDRFQVRSVPYCMLFKEGQAVTHCSGFRIQIFNQIFSPLLCQYKAPKSQKAKNCPEGHPLKLCAILPVQLYPQGYFFCNICRRIQRCSTEKTVAHCEACDYDLCVQCYSS